MLGKGEAKKYEPRYIKKGSIVI